MTDTAMKADKVVAHPRAAVTPRGNRRAILFAGLAGVVALAAAGYAGWYVLVGARQEATDDAYVAADTALVTPLVVGPVREVRVADTQAVKAGQVVAVIDDTDARIAVAQAEAALAQAERRVRGYFANDEALGAQVAARAADQDQAAAQVAAAEASLEKARTDLDRRTKLQASGAVSGDELTAAQNAFANARAALASARAAKAQAAAARDAAAGQLKASAVMTAGSTVDTNPEVAVARARLNQARVDLDRTVVRAPIDGVVAKRQVQVGQRVAPGMQMMTIVPIGQAYVEANFKEVQLQKVRPGQPVELESDLYGSKVRFHGKVAGLGGGTGSAFAIVPAQNATGNWIKVVQRVPVRIALDPEDLRAHPLRLGLSMKAVVRTAP